MKGTRNYDIPPMRYHADYDMKTPLNSGFLMEDGKLTASDIMNMTAVPFLLSFSQCLQVGTYRYVDSRRGL
jgi:hypothetical protein